MFGFDNKGNLAKMQEKSYHALKQNTPAFVQVGGKEDDRGQLTDDSLSVIVDRCSLFVGC